MSIFEPPLPTTLEEARHQAMFAYDSARCWEDDGLDGPDTLHKVEAPASALLELLDDRPDNINRRRLLWELTGDDPDPSGDRAVAVGDKLDDMLRFLDKVRLAARRAHIKRGAGRPGAKDDLRAAYSVLAEFWQREHPEMPIANGWDKEDPRMATNRGAGFLLDELRRIDPTRERLVEELKDIITGIVKVTPGPRRGRINLKIFFFFTSQ